MFTYSFNIVTPSLISNSSICSKSNEGQITEVISHLHTLLHKFFLV